MSVNLGYTNKSFNVGLIIQEHMTRLFLTLLILALLAPALQGRRHKQVLQELKAAPEERETVVEANHFSSATQSKNSYDITDLEKDKALLFILKPHSTEASDTTLSTNPITITLKVGTESKSCIFNSYTQLCVIPKVTSVTGTFGFECVKTPCELSWIILQPASLLEDGDHSVDSLVSVNKDKNHASLTAFCNNADLATKFNEGLVLYTNSKYKRAAVEHRGVGLVHFLFDNDEEGYYYLTSSDDQVKQCVNATLEHMNDEIIFGGSKSFSDFLQPEKQNSYEFKSIPDKDFRMDAQAYDIAMNELNNDTSIKVILHGIKGGKRMVISSYDLLIDNEKTSADFNVVFKRVEEKYDTMEIELGVTGQTLLFNAMFIAADVQQVQLGELSFFDLKKGQVIKYKLMPVGKDVEGIDQVHIFAPSKKIKASAVSCPSAGCMFQIEALEDNKGNIYLGESATMTTREQIYQKIQKSVTARIGPVQQRHYTYEAKANEALQFLINVPSAVVYAASKARCPAIDIEKKCYDVSFNHHFPAIYEPKKDGPIIFKVIGLDYTQFTLTVVDEKTPFLELNDTIPFAYLFDDAEKELVFEFKMKTKEDVYFNLIGPVNELNLYVLNEEKPAQSSKLDWTAAELSSDGFIKFEKENVKGLNFAIKVEKREQFVDKYAHFTLIASTKEANLRLETGAAHYETLKPKDTRDYVFEFESGQRTILNFYTHNIHRAVNISLKISNVDEYDKAENTAQFTVDKYVDVMDLSLVSERLCKENQGENCQLFVRIENLMEVEIDTTITLMNQNAIVELKDGIWQSYAVNDITGTSHYYFLPKHPKHSATIFYKPEVVDLRVVYSVWKSDDLSINPSKWPFPESSESSVERFDFKPLQYIHVEPDKLKACWPNCVILLSLVTNNKAFQQAVDRNDSNLEAHFRIMASNSYIEIPEKHKVDVLLSKNESKELLVDLKYCLDKEHVTFYTHHTVGNAKLKANVYSESNPRCPTLDDSADFELDSTETSIEIEMVKNKMSENSMEGDQNVYLCVLAQASQSSKFNIEYSSNKDGFRKLGVDTTTTLKGSNKDSLYYIDNSQEIYLKLSRNQGFPFYSTKLCNSEEEMRKCFDDFEEDKDVKGTQLANKDTTLSEKPCPKCILLIRISSKEETEVVLHAQSKFTELQLSSGSMVLDSLSANEQNRYTLTGTRDEEIIINIQINSGDLKVGVHDFEKVNFERTNSKGSKNIHIIVPPKDLTPAQKKLGESHMSSFGLSSFVHLHITVESQDHAQPASYSITYSSGEAVVYLQDGLIAEYNLIGKKETKFIYKNPSGSAIYLYTSTSDLESLKKLKLEYYALNDQEDEDEATILTPNKSDFQKKTANPTHFAMLPPKSAYFFKVTNQQDKNTIFTIGVNNREIVYLPFDHEFPIELAPKEYIYLVLNTAVGGYVKVTFSKCSISYPYIGYTTNYDDFIREDYSIEEQMNEDLSNDLFLKVKPSKSLYIKVRSSDTEKALMTVKATFSTNKIKPGRAKPGDKGLIQYQLLDSTKAELTFSTLVCSEGRNCQKDFTYTALRATQIDAIYAQLICPSIMFNTPSIRQLKSATLTPIATTPSSSKVAFTQIIDGDVEYISVKAVNSKTGEVVYYQPVEIITFWGELHRSTGTTVVLLLFFVVIFGCGGLMVYRRYKRNEYRPLGELNDNLERD